MSEKIRVPFTKQLLITLFASSVLSIIFLVLRMLVTQSFDYWFLSWNLLLAWIPLLFALGLRIRLFSHPFLEWKSIALFGLWLGFLPNSFYILSDMVHLQSSGETIILFDIAMISSYIINGLILGYMSVYIIHVQLAKRLTRNQLISSLGLIFLSCGFAIYIGRYLRWNTWDVLFNPAGILFDVTERLINPIAHIETYVVTFSFFLILSVTYAIIYQVAKVLGANPRH